MTPQTKGDWTVNTISIDHKGTGRGGIYQRSLKYDLTGVPTSTPNINLPEMPEWI